MIHGGGCHCGNLRFELETALPLTALPLRVCQCSFCRRHGAVSTSDPAGRVKFEMRDTTQVVHYRFGLRTADFLICGRCGIYVGATCDEGGSHRWGIVNANALDAAVQLVQTPTPMDYSGEDAAARLARRRARWTPLTA